MKVLKSVLIGAGVASVLMLTLFWLGPKASDTPFVRTYDEPLRYPTDPLFVEDIVIVSQLEVPTEPPTCTVAPTATCTPAPVPTCTPEPTEVVVTPTRKPTERVVTRKATNTPTPTQKAVKMQNKAYPTGYPHEQTVKNPEKHTWKPYARHTAITNKSSAQWKLLQREKTADNGLRYVTDPDGVGRYCIALAPQWAGGTAKDIGRCVDLYMVNGEVIKCVLADIKKPEHTIDKAGYFGSRNELVEWIVDINKISEKVRKSGDVSNAGDEFAGGVRKVVVLDLYIDGFGR